MSLRGLGTVAIVGLFAVALQVGILYKQSLHVKAPEVPEPVACLAFDHAAALDRFRRLLTFPTVSSKETPDHVTDHEAMRGMLEHLEQSYPAVWRTMTVEEVGAGGYSRLLTWHGSDTSLDPVLFISHYDVVPVTPGTEGEWKHGPFSGDVADGYVWGRGTIDIKFSVAALLEAATALIQGGGLVQPTRTLMFAFGHDEEVGGGLGANATARLLASRGVRLAAVLDEGGAVLADGMRPFVTDTPVALVGLAEKGYSVIRVVLRSPGGHASMPPTDGSDIGTQVWRLYSALLVLQTPTQLAAPVTDMLRELAPYAPPVMRPLLANADARQSWFVNRLLGFAFRRLLSRDTAAMVADTIATTRLICGVADNVLPQEGTVSFNVRVLPGHTPGHVVEHLRRALKLARIRGAEVQLVEESAWAGSAVTSAAGRPFQLLRRAIQESWPRPKGQPHTALPVIPMLVMGGTDSKHYAPLSEGGILRFVPFGLNKTAGDLGLIHSTNERIPADDFRKAVCVYARVLQLMGSDWSAEPVAAAAAAA
ncbi:hypothetical protein HYH02_002722 [Chlamydomonas schloesseri]|uniref:Peptidase M20 dimerisation domain-containing protein n=1 Tax=Chlamydomonas schloesseri TaxID=2026947 RepID=A0A836BAI5_9CHLO|nr:hypothetical protein HYH02_002722 [Chlamydomonas schloesseri]|eukprot:KAG2452483.1 hypothetical protein HYH02_002722 [Chlamydomonas schloesseri]